MREPYLSWLSRLLEIKKKYIESSILKQWSKDFYRGHFPNFGTDENSAFGRARITTFRSDSEWLVVFETLVYIGEADSYQNVVRAYGNKVDNPLLFLDLFTLPGINTDEMLDDSYDNLNPLHFVIALHGVERVFTLTISDYVNNDVDLDKPITGDRVFDTRVNVLRLLVNILPPDELFLSNATMLELLDHPLDMPLFLQLYEWHHPDFNAGEKVNTSSCLVSLAKALANNDKSLYHCLESSFNTHWSNWKV